ncbi:MAG: ABC transporter substrate-binding protein [Gammaproteobacteria bacterium]|nr:ABC transporter substrate-binding protein [Gammaproteobacteria bacterium]
MTRRMLLLVIAVFASFVEAAAIEDGWGRDVLIEGRPERVAALAPHLVENLFAIGVGDRVVAAVSFTDYPPDARLVPRVGDAFALSWESLTAQRPDLILAWGGSLTPERLSRLEGLGVPVYVSEPRSLADVERELRGLAQALEGDVGVADAFRDRLAALGFGQQERPLQVLPLISGSPLLTLSRDHFVDDLLSRCQAVNPFAKAVGPVVRLSAERLLRSELDLILNLSSAPLPDSLHLPRGVRVADLDPDLFVRPGPRVIEGAEALCGLLQELR